MRCLSLCCTSLNILSFSPPLSSHSLEHFAAISNRVVARFVAKQKQLGAEQREAEMLSRKAFQTKADQKRVAELASLAVVRDSAFLADTFLPAMDKLSSLAGRCACSRTSCCCS